MKTTLTLQMAGQHPGPGIAGRQGWIQLEGWQIRSRSWQSSRSSKEYNLIHFSLAGSWLITLTLAVQMSAAVRTAGVSVQGQMVSPGSGWRCSCTFGPQPGSRSPGLGLQVPGLPAALGSCQQCRGSNFQGWHSRWHEYIGVKADVTCTISTFPRYLYIRWALSMWRCRALMWPRSALAEPNPDSAGSISCR